MKQEIENIIKKNLPEKKEAGLYTTSKATGGDIINYNREDNDDKRDAFNQALSEINTSLIADEVLKVVVEKIESIRIIEERDCRDLRVTPAHSQIEPLSKYSQGFNASLDILKSLIHLSPNKENKNNE